MANAIMNGQSNVKEINAATAATARTADGADLAPPPFDYAPDVAGNDAGAARFRCPTEKG